jgi:very-short-patch-repair endonuclease
MASLDDRLLPIFTRQHWLATMDDIRTAGGTPQAATRRVASGRWAWAEPGVVRLAGPPVTWHSRVHAPGLSIRTAVASHRTAAALHQVPSFGRGLPEISVRREERVTRSTVRVHTSTDLERARVVTVDGIDVTDLPRTLLDLARTVRPERLASAMEWSRRERNVTWTDLASTLAHHARCGRPGIVRFREVLTTRLDTTTVTDSDFELMVLALLREHGIDVVLHHVVRAGDRFVAEVDLAIPALRIAIELDGSVHLDRDVHDRDLRRQNDLLLEGWLVLRFTWRRFADHPEQLVAELLAAIHARGG